MWYTVSLLFKSYHEPASDDVPIWEESIRLIEANSEDEAQSKAEKIGGSERITFQAIAGNNVNWRFERVALVYEIDFPLTDGVEIFSRFLTEAEVESMARSFEDHRDS